MMRGRERDLRLGNRVVPFLAKLGSGMYRWPKLEHRMPFLIGYQLGRLQQRVLKKISFDSLVKSGGDLTHIRKERRCSQKHRGGMGQGMAFLG